MIACLFKDFKAIKILIEKGKVKMNEVDFKGRSCYDYARRCVITGKPIYSSEIAKYLVD